MLESRYKLKYGSSVARSQIDGMPPDQTSLLVERGKMTLRQIRDMDVVSHTGPILGVVVGTVNC